MSGLFTVQIVCLVCIPQSRLTSQHRFTNTGSTHVLEEGCVGKDENSHNGHFDTGGDVSIDQDIDRGKDSDDKEGQQSHDFHPVSRERGREGDLQPDFQSAKL